MKRILLFLGSLLIVTGCGLGDIAEKTLTQVQASNDHQTELLAYMKLTSALTQAIKNYNAQVAEGIHLQILSNALDGLLAPENTEVLFPPFGMMPYAEAYAKEATPLELVRTIDLFLKRVYLTPSEFERVRQVCLVALGLIAALAPQEKIEIALIEQVSELGAYEEAAYAMGTTRFHFTRDFLFNPIYETSDIQNLSTLKMALGYFENLGYLVNRPYVGKFILNVPSLGVDYWGVSQDEYQSLGARAKRSFSSKLPAPMLEEAQPLLAKFDV